jgi:hypothetical protein
MSGKAVAATRLQVARAVLERDFVCTGERRKDDANGMPAFEND